MQVTRARLFCAGQGDVEALGTERAIALAAFERAAGGPSPRSLWLAADQASTSLRIASSIPLVVAQPAQQMIMIT